MIAAEKRRPWYERVLAGFGAALGLLVLLVIAWPRVIYPKIAVRVFGSIGTVSYARLVQKAGIALVARAYRPVDFSRASAAEAGQALHALAQWSVTDNSKRLIAPFDAARQSRPVELPDQNALHILSHVWFSELMPMAAKGFSTDQRRYLDSITRDPDLALFETIANARDMDVIGARYSLEAPGDAWLFFRTLPIAKLGSVKRAAELSVARAALQLARGDPAAAERTLRGSANVGLLLIDNGSEVVDVLVGAVVARQSLLALASLYDVTRRGAAADHLRRLIDRSVFITDSLPPALTEKDPTSFAVRDLLPSVAARNDLPPGLKWEYLISVQSLDTFSYCVGEFRFDEGYESWRDTVRSGLVRRPSDGAFFDWITAAPTTKRACPKSD